MRFISPTQLIHDRQISGLVVGFLLAGVLGSGAPIAAFGSEKTISWDAPTYHDFGPVGVGVRDTFVAEITNTGTEDFHLTYSAPDTSQSFFWGSGSAIVRPGTTRLFGVIFKPVVPGNHSIWLDLGDVVPPILLVGEGISRPEEFSIEPDSIDFGWHFVGEGYTYAAVFIYNPGGTFLELDVHLADEELGFSVSRGGGNSFLPPGDDHLIHVRFWPDTVGEFATVLNLGPLLPPVPVTGKAEPTTGLCVNLPDTLVFGPIPAGGSQTLTYSVTNNSHQVISINPRIINSPEFLADDWADLGPGQSQTFEVEFRPQLPLNYSGTLTLNHTHCSEITLLGTATPPLAVEQNLVGIFMDPNYTTIDTKTYQYNQLVTAYLVMLNPSETSGVGSWELALDIDGDAQWLGWNIEGQYINVGNNNELIVGIGGEPLPYGPEILLATGYLQVTHPYPSVVNLGLKPIWNASIPGQMAWSPWHDASMLIPLHTMTGQEIVAGINWNSLADVETPHAVPATRLMPNVPNPFNPRTEIRFELDRPQQVKVAVYDVTGRLVKVLAARPFAAGPHKRTWQGRDAAGRPVPSGVYYVRMVAESRTEHLKIMLLK